MSVETRERPHGVKPHAATQSPRVPPTGMFPPLRGLLQLAVHLSDRRLWGDKFGAVNVANGSGVPIRNFRMQPFGRKLVAVVEGQARTTAIANADLLDDIGEGQVSKWSGLSPRKLPRAPLGRPVTVKPTNSSPSS